MAKGSITFRDVAYFLAEVAVYVAVVWWGFSRAVPSVARWGLGVGLLAVFAVSWGVCAAPGASLPLHGWLGTAFRVVWFGLGLAAAVSLVAAR